LNPDLLLRPVVPLRVILEDYQVLLLKLVLLRPGITEEWTFESMSQPVDQFQEPLRL